MTEKNEMTVKFWGVRGSYPTPGADTVTFGGNTASVEVRVASQTIILDAGTGIIPLGRDLMRRAQGKPLTVTMLFSHMHHDHTQGFPFFAPAFVPSTRMHLFGAQSFQRDLEQVLVGNMIPPVFPVTLQDMGASKQIQSVSENQVILIDENGTPYLVLAGSPEAYSENCVRIRMMKSSAHPGGVMIYRVEYRDLSLVYATDSEGYVQADRKLAAFAQGADLLIHDAQYLEDHYLGQNGFRSTQGWGHSTAAMACDVARQANVKQLALFHHDPSYNDTVVAGIETDAQARFSGAFAAREGLEVTLKSERHPEQPALARATWAVA
jgi:phosphoribosyl 1,2-cyclic phosphodiesterase